MTAQPLPAGQPTSTQDANRGSLIGTILIGITLIAFVALIVIQQQSDIVALTVSSLAFPALLIAPFVLTSLKLPLGVKVAAVLIMALVLIPILGIENTSYFELAIQIGTYAAMALGLNIVVGFAGLLDLGYIAFFAVGAYLWGLFTSQAGMFTKTGETVTRLLPFQVSPEAFWIFIFLGLGAAGLAGILLGLPVLRLKGDYLAIVTLGFGEIIRTFFSNLGDVSNDTRTLINITNGAQGLSGIAKPTVPAFMTTLVREFESLANAIPGVPDVRVDNPDLAAGQLFFFLIILAVIGVVILIVQRLDNSAIGRAWTAIREDETAAIAMGVPLVRMKLLAFAMGASFAGAMGVIYAAKNSFVSPESFSFNQSIFILAIVIVGGMGSIRGVILGAMVVYLLNLQILKNLSQLLQAIKNNPTQVPAFIANVVTTWPVQLEPARYERLVFGLVLVIMMIVRPSGILPARRRRLELSTPDPVDQVAEPTDSTTMITDSAPAGDKRKN